MSTPISTMNFKNNGDKEIRQRCEEREKNDKWYVGSHKIRISCHGNNVLISWNQGGLIPDNDEIKVSKNPFNWFGLKNHKSFEERIQNAVDKIQKRCDKYDRQELMELEIKKGLFKY